MSEQTAPTRALNAAGAGGPLARAGLAVRQLDLGRVAQHLYPLMFRNVSSDGFAFTDSTHRLVSQPGCVIAAPSYPANAPGISQDYVFNWVRDAAIVMLEVSAAAEVDRPSETLADYVRFADSCQRNATPTPGHACFTIDARSRPWSEQNDGPAIQIVALLGALGQLDPETRTLATDLIARNLDFLLGCYQEPTTNLWEEHHGYSFFARSVQLRCFREISANAFGLPVPDGLVGAIGWLEEALEAHWNGRSYLSMLEPADGVQGGTGSSIPGYDPNIDIVQASIYGALPCTDTKMLATAAQLRALWTDPSSAKVYPINLSDAELGLGPMLGRYPDDHYDGGSGSQGDHPWPLCTANFAQLYFKLAHDIEESGSLPLDELSEPFFAQVGVTSETSVDASVVALNAAGDAMLRAVITHSDQLELSEQFDGVTGYEKSVRDLTWSYAAFLSAVRVRTGVAVIG